MAVFVFHFCATYLKIQDLSEVEKMDRFVHALVTKIRLQVELCGPLNFHEAVMYGECADVVITCVFGQDTCKPWQKSFKGGS